MTAEETALKSQRKMRWLCLCRVACWGSALMIVALIFFYSTILDKAKLIPHYPMPYRPYNVDKIAALISVRADRDSMTSTALTTATPSKQQFHDNETADSSSRVPLASLKLTSAKFVDAKNIDGSIHQPKEQDAVTGYRKEYSHKNHKGNASRTKLEGDSWGLYHVTESHNDPDDKKKEGQKTKKHRNSDDESEDEEN